MQMTFQIAPNEAKWRSAKEPNKNEQKRKEKEKVEKLKHYEYYYQLQGASKQTDLKRGGGRGHYR